MPTQITHDVFDSRRHSRRLKAVAKYLNGGTVVLGIAAFVLPDYHHLATTLLIALPWVAVWLVARLQPLYRFSGKRNHPNLVLPLFLPGLLLTAQALTEAHTFDVSGPLILACCGGLALTAAALRADPGFRQQRWTTILICVFLLSYGFGAGLEIDMLADSSPATIYHTQVLAKRASHGSKSTTYYLKVGPWGPITGADEISVPASRFHATHTGETICVYVGRGALLVPWYHVWDCPTS